MIFSPKYSSEFYTGFASYAGKLFKNYTTKNGFRLPRTACACPTPLVISLRQYIRLLSVFQLLIINHDRSSLQPENGSLKNTPRPAQTGPVPD